MHKQVIWQATSEGLNATGRREILARYREMRRRGINRYTCRIAAMSAAHGAWMAKEGGW